MKCFLDINEKHTQHKVHQVFKMTAINSLYISCIEKRFNANFIAAVFVRNSIAQVRKVYIEPYKSNRKYNRAYIDIELWYDTEAAYNFIQRLRSPFHEARIVYGDDNWWVVDINKYPAKLNLIKKVLTVFVSNVMDDDDISTTAVADVEDSEFVAVDANKTELLRNIVANFKDTVLELPARKQLYRINSIDNDCNRKVKAYMYGFKDDDEMESAAALEDYLHEIDILREKFICEQFDYEYLFE